MSSQSQIKANRNNALKSTGPRTAEGKEASLQNALKHGLRTNRNVIKTENQEEYELFRDNMIADLSPDGAMEEVLAERIVSLSWRLKRAEHFQNAVIDALIEHGLHGASFGFGWTSENRERAQKEAESGEMDVMLGIVINHDFANSRTLEQLLVYERRIESSLYRTIAELKKMKHMRKEQETETAWASSESHPHSEKDIQNEDATRSQNANCTNEAKLDGNGWHPQAELGDGLNRACLPYSEKDIKDEDITQDACTNEAKSPTCGEKSVYLISKSKIMGGEPETEQTNPN